MLEFTGERVVPGLVDTDLWNEHYSRYEFAARLARGRRVIDLGCGSGYGSAELAKVGSFVLGVDSAPEAIAFARSHYTAPNLRFEQSPCEDVPPEAGRFDLAVSFEVIEHLSDPRRLVQSARALLSPGGQFIVSTPNAAYYQEARRQAGPNPFHTREFQLEEFQELLHSCFEFVSLYAQNHAPAITFYPLSSPCPTPQLRTRGDAPDPRSAHYFVAICAFNSQVGNPLFVYLPTSGNVLREREKHIHRLEGELAQKQLWLDRATQELSDLEHKHEQVETELRAANTWAKDRESQLLREIDEARATAIGLKAHLAKRDAELAIKIDHIQSLLAENADLHGHARRLDAAFQEKTAHVQTLLADSAALRAKFEELQRQLAESQQEREQLLLALSEQSLRIASLESDSSSLRQRQQLAAQSRWLRLGRKFNLGPDLTA